MYLTNLFPWNYLAVDVPLSCRTRWCYSWCSSAWAAAVSTSVQLLWFYPPCRLLCVATAEMSQEKPVLAAPRPTAMGSQTMQDPRGKREGKKPVASFFWREEGGSQQQKGPCALHVLGAVAAPSPAWLANGRLRIPAPALVGHGSVLAIRWMSRQQESSHGQGSAWEQLLSGWWRCEQPQPK